MQYTCITDLPSACEMWKKCCCIGVLCSAMKQFANGGSNWVKAMLTALKKQPLGEVISGIWMKCASSLTNANTGCGGWLTEMAMSWISYCNHVGIKKLPNAFSENCSKAYGTLLALLLPINSLVTAQLKRSYYPAQSIARIKDSIIGRRIRTSRLGSRKSRCTNSNRPSSASVFYLCMDKSIIFSVPGVIKMRLMIDDIFFRKLFKLGIILLQRRSVSKIWKKVSLWDFYAFLTTS